MGKISSGEENQKSKIKISRDLNYPKTSWLLRVREARGAAWVGQGACRTERGLESLEQREAVRLSLERATEMLEPRTQHTFLERGTE